MLIGSLGADSLGINVNIIMSANCEIKFDHNPHGVYLPGQTLSGTVELCLKDTLTMKGVVLQIKGRAKVKWSKTSTIGDSHYVVKYRGRQDYMNSTTYLIGSNDGSNIELPTGLHAYRFSFILPTDLVTSLEADKGHIRYTVKVMLERSWKVDYSYKKAFTVLRHVNLNEENLEVRLPSKVAKQKHFLWGPFKSAPLLMIIETPISGYAPGQTIAVRIEVDNQSNRQMKGIITRLVREVSLISQSPHTKVQPVYTVVSEVQCIGVEKRSKGSTMQYLNIPPLPPTNRTCQVMTVNYFVEVEGNISGPASNPKVQIPITLGTIPLTTNAVPNFDNAASTSTSIVVQPMTVLHENLRPPSYEEAILSCENNVQEKGETNKIGWKEYTPCYTIYHFNEEDKTHPYSNSKKYL
ncbi:arrestin domain-containing protein 3-like [Armigeres subalbatus]|uniref:arrestin domain-containing protein 3-like n=1 Tax=Armigeres subalbatus TaxID=124917 RepID=UPI002ED508C1